MPTYDYKCQQCDHTFEHFQTMSDARLEECPECEGSVRRLVSGGAGLIFKGSGFYITDYAKKESSEKTNDVKKESPEKTNDVKKESPEKTNDTKKKPLKESSKK